MNLQLQNAIDAPLELGPRYLLSVDAWAPRVKAEEFLGRSGGYPVGDWESPPRVLRLSRNAGFTNDAAFIEAANQIPKFMRKAAAPHYLVDTDLSRRCLIVPTELPAEWSPGLERRQLTGTLKFIMLLSVWEDTESVLTENAALASGASMVVSNASDRDILGIITVEALTDLPEFTLINETTGFGFKFSGVSLTAGKKLEIDPTYPNGRVRAGNSLTGWVDASANIVDGSPYIMLPVGSSSIKYTSVYGACSLSVETRGEWPE